MMVIGDFTNRAICDCPGHILKYGCNISILFTTLSLHIGLSSNSNYLNSLSFWNALNVWNMKS